MDAYVFLPCSLPEAVQFDLFGDWNVAFRQPVLHIRGFSGDFDVRSGLHPYGVAGVVEGYVHLGRPVGFPGEFEFTVHHFFLIFRSYIHPVSFHLRAKKSDGIRHIPYVSFDRNGLLPVSGRSADKDSKQPCKCLHKQFDL